ncbi:MAG: tetratricopeptide repeat protein, partial [Patescibacteria group bacterium]
SGALALGSLFLYLRFREGGSRAAFRGSFAALLLSLLAKPTAMVLPFVFLLLHWREGTSPKGKALKEALPFFFLSSVFLAIGFFRKAENIQSLTLLQTALLSAKSTVLSTSLFLFPRFSLLFLQATPVALRSAEFFLPLFLLLAVTVAVRWSLRRTRDVAFGLGIAALFLLPSFANFSKAGAVYVTSDRYMYLAQVGFLFLLGILLMRLLHSSRTVRGITAAAVSTVLIIAGWGAWRRSLLWHDSETLFTAALARNPASAELRNNMGILREEDGDLEGARGRYEDALRVRPSFAPALYGLGKLAQATGDGERALALYREATEADPRFLAAYNALGSLLQDRGNLDGAIAAFRGALEVKPNFAQTRINLADAYGKKGMYREGLQEYMRVMEFNPEFREEILRKVPQIEDVNL